MFPDVACNHSDNLLSPTEVVKLLGGNLSAVTLARWREKDCGPRFVKLGAARARGVLVRYRVADIHDWLGSLPTGGGTGRRAAAAQVSDDTAVVAAVPEM
jgi:predicted DNA-binding transcriptional regulator AlpA